MKMTVLLLYELSRRCKGLEIEKTKNVINCYFHKKLKSYVSSSDFKVDSIIGSWQVPITLFNTTSYPQNIGDLTLSEYLPTYKKMALVRLRYLRHSVIRSHHINDEFQF